MPRVQDVPQLLAYLQLRLDWMDYTFTPAGKRVWLLLAYSDRLSPPSSASSDGNGYAMALAIVVLHEPYDSQRLAPEQTGIKLFGDS